LWIGATEQVMAALIPGMMMDWLPMVKVSPVELVETLVLLAYKA
jgi:hypothetical protein